MGREITNSERIYRLEKEIERLRDKVNQFYIGEYQVLTNPHMKEYFEKKCSLIKDKRSIYKKVKSKLFKILFKIRKFF